MLEVIRDHECRPSRFLHGATIDDIVGGARGGNTALALKKLNGPVGEVPVRALIAIDAYQALEETRGVIAARAEAVLSREPGSPRAGRWMSPAILWNSR